MTIVLHDHGLLADAYKVRLFLALAGVAHETRTVAILPGPGADAPAYRALAPAGTVPTLVDGDLVLTRPEAMLVHLAERHAGPGWLPTDPAARAGVFDWLAFAAGDLRAAEAARLRAMFGRPSDLADPLAAARAAFRVLEGHLVRRGLDGFVWVAGDRATIADVALFPAVALAADAGIGMEEFPSLLLWARGLHALPGFVTMPGVREVI